MARIDRRTKAERYSVIPLTQAKKIPILSLLPDRKSKKIGKVTYICCPLCEDSEYSLKITTKNDWTCNSCLKGGSNVELIQELYGFTFVDAVKRIVQSVENRGY